MRVEKDADGKFFIVDEPFVLTGEAAEEFLRRFEERNRRGNTPEEEAFLEECRRVYEQSKPKSL